MYMYREINLCANVIASFGCLEVKALVTFEQYTPSFEHSLLAKSVGFLPQ